MGLQLLIDLKVEAKLVDLYQQNSIVLLHDCLAQLASFLPEHIVLLVLGSKGVVIAQLCPHGLGRHVRIRTVLLHPQRYAIGGITQRLYTLGQFAQDRWFVFVLDGWRTKLLLLQAVGLGPGFRRLDHPLLQVSQTHPLILIDFQAFPDEVLELLGDGDCLLELDGYLGHLVNELAFRSALPRGLTMQHLVDHNADRPDIILGGVDVLLECFRRHVEWTAHIVLLLLEGTTA